MQGWQDMNLEDDDQEMKVVQSSALFLAVTGWLLLPSQFWADTISVRRLDSVSIRAVCLPRHATGVQILKSEDMNRVNVIDLTDGLRRMGGVLLRDYGGAGGMKTVSVRGLGSSHTAASVDGIVQSDVHTGQVDFSRFNFMPVDEIQVSVAGNADAMASARVSASTSVIGFEGMKSLRQPPAGFKPAVRFMARQGSFDYWNGGLSYEQFLSRKWGVRLSGNYAYVENDYPYTLVNGLRKSRMIRRNNKMNTTNIDVSSSYRLGNGSYLDVRTSYYENHHQLPGRVVLYNPVNNEKQMTRHSFAHACLSMNVNADWKLAFRAKWDWNDCSYSDANGIYKDGIWKEYYNQQESYLSGVVQFNACKWLKMSYAADVFRNDLNSNQSVNGDVSRNTFLQCLSFKAEFPRLSVEVKSMASIYDNDAESVMSAKDYSHLNFSVSSLYRLFAPHGLYLRLYQKSIFRMPTFTENYYYHLGNADLLPEKADQWGIGFLWQRGNTSWWPLMKCSVDAYYNCVSDKITSIPINLHQWRTINIGEVHIWGVDAMLENQFRWNGRHSVFLYGNATFSRVADMTTPGSPTYKHQLAYNPKFSGSVSLAYENPVLNTSVTLVGNSSQWGTHEHASSTLVNGFGELTASVWRSFRVTDASVMLIRLSMVNICNKQYMLINGYPMPGRAYRIDMNINL